MHDEMWVQRMTGVDALGSIAQSAPTRDRLVQEYDRLHMVDNEMNANTQRYFRLYSKRRQRRKVRIDVAVKLLGLGYPLPDGINAQEDSDDSDDEGAEEAAAAAKRAAAAKPAGAGAVVTPGAAMALFGAKKKPPPLAPGSGEDAAKRRTSRNATEALFGGGSAAAAARKASLSFSEHGDDHGALTDGNGGGKEANCGEGGSARGSGDEAEGGGEEGADEEALPKVNPKALAQAVT